MQIAAVQTNIFWEDPVSNYEHLDNLLKEVSKVDLIVLPEMFTTGFTMNSMNVAEEGDGRTLKWMKELSVKKNAAVTGSVVIKEEGSFFNRLYWVEPSKEHQYYDKKHLFRMADENRYYSQGKNRLITNFREFRICPMICYDLRFPVWSRNINKDKNPVYDCLIYVANWPEPRTDAWTSLLKARAIENQAYVIGVNRVGQDGNKVNYAGGSSVFDTKGERLDQFKPGQQQVETIFIDKVALQDFRRKFPVSLDGDPFTIIE